MVSVLGDDCDIVFIFIVARSHAKFVAARLVVVQRAHAVLRATPPATGRRSSTQSRDSYFFLAAAFFLVAGFFLHLALGVLAQAARLAVLAEAGAAAVLALAARLASNRSKCGRGSMESPRLTPSVPGLVKQMSLGWLDITRFHGTT